MNAGTLVGGVVGFLAGYYIVCNYMTSKRVV